MFDFGIGCVFGSILEISELLYDLLVRASRSVVTERGSSRSHSGALPSQQVFSPGIL
jgi:hypothetical protein